MKKQGSTSVEFIQRLDRIDAESPQDSADVKETLESLGLKSEQLVKEAVALVESFEQEQRAARLAEASRKRKAELVRLGSRSKTSLVEAALLQRLEHLRGRPGGEQLHFKDLKSCSRAELEALLDEFSYLDEEDGPKED